MKQTSLLLTFLAATLMAIPLPQTAHAMCGCMIPIRPPRPKEQQLVARKLLNEASKVVLVREGDQTIMTMSNDVITDLDEFGLVVPVPTVITKKDVRVVESAVFTALENVTNPRIVERWDPDPCPTIGIAMADAESAPRAPKAASGAAPRRKRAADFGVKVEAHYSVGEYDIAVLSAKAGAGSGLMKWLNRFHYEIPPAAVPALNSYIKQSMRFFVAKVNFRKVDRTKGRVFLRPIQVRYETPKFMLPVRLGTINADGPQELVAYMLSPKGRIEATNYQTVRMPAGHDVPLYVKDQFEKTYKAIFDAQTKKHEMRAIFVEYVGRGTLDQATYTNVGLGWGRRAAPNAFAHFTATRLHFRYDSERFPEDLVLQETADVTPFSVTYSVHHQARNVQCEEGKAYLAKLPPRRAKEAEALASLTQWDLPEIREKMGLTAAPAVQPAPTSAEKKEKKWWEIW